MMKAAKRDLKRSKGWSGVDCEKDGHFGRRAVSTSEEYTMSPEAGKSL